jgi:DNA-binding NarL/FixJ family response regulator
LPQLTVLESRSVITVAIIEDNRLVREGMADMLNELPDVKVVLEGSTDFLRKK